MGGQYITAQLLTVLHVWPSEVTFKYYFLINGYIKNNEFHISNAKKREYFGNIRHPDISRRKVHLREIKYCICLNILI